MPGDLIRCPDWERLAPPAVLAGAKDGQTERAFASRTRRPGPSGKPASAGTSRPAACSHAVAAGDTLGAIAARRLGKASRWREVAALNPGADPKRLRIGATLRLPCAAGGGAGEGGAGDPPARAALLARPEGAVEGAAAAPAPSGTAPEGRDAAPDGPALPPPPVWTAAQGEFLSDVLARWGKAAGWTVIVDTADAWRLAVAFRTQAAFDAAVAELVRGMGHDGVPPRVRLYPNRVLRLGGPL